MARATRYESTGGRKKRKKPAKKPSPTVASGALGTGLLGDAAKKIQRRKRRMLYDEY